MKAALIEQGFNPTSMRINQLVAWEESERTFMEKILKRYGLEREIKDETYPHMDLGEYKESQHEKELRAELWEKTFPENLSAENIRGLQRDNSLLKIENQKLQEQKNSPWKSFFYSSPEKQAYVQSILNELKIPYRETENGFEAQECYVNEIRKLEKNFTPTQNPRRDELRNNLDKIVMQSSSYDDVLVRLEKSGYEIKQGKYVAVKPKYGSQFIRLKSLGEDYSEQAIRNRITNKRRFENDIDSKINSAGRSDTLDVVIQKTVKHYIMVFEKGVLPVRKINKKKPFTWTNCEELDRLSELNKKINAGANLESLRNDFTELEKCVSDKEKQLVKLKNELVFFIELQNAAKRFYELGNSSNSDIEFLMKHKITEENYRRIQIPLNGNEVEIAAIEKSLPGDYEKLKNASSVLSAAEKIAAGTFVQSLIDEEKERRQSNVVMNGLKRID